MDNTVIIILVVAIVGNLAISGFHMYQLFDVKPMQLHMCETRREEALNREKNCLIEKNHHSAPKLFGENCINEVGQNLTCFARLCHNKAYHTFGVQVPRNSHHTTTYVQNVLYNILLNATHEALSQHHMPIVVSHFCSHHL